MDKVSRIRKAWDSFWQKTFFYRESSISTPSEPVIQQSDSKKTQQLKQLLEEYFQQHKYLTSSALQKKTHIDRKSCYLHLSRAKKLGLIKRIGYGIYVKVTKETTHEQKTRKNSS